MRGIGETFQPNLFSGTGNHVVPIAVSQGRNGFGPALTLEYSSGNGNGPFGLGWQLSIPRVTRKTEKGLPRYDDTDTFVLSGRRTSSLSWNARVDPGTGNDVMVSGGPDRAPAARRATIPPSHGDGVRADRAVAARRQRRDPLAGDQPRQRHERLRRVGRRGDRRPERSTARLRVAAGGAVRRRRQPRPLRVRGRRPGAPPTEIFEENRRITQRYIRRICYGNLPTDLVDRDGQPVTYPDGSAVGYERDGRRYAFEVVFDYGDWDLPTRDPHPATLPARPAGAVRCLGPGAHGTGSRASGLASRCGPSGAAVGCSCSTTSPSSDGPTLVRSTDLAYHDDPATLLSFLTSVTVTGYRREGPASYTSASLPPVTFGYSEFRPQEQRYQSHLRAGRRPAAVRPRRQSSSRWSTSSATGCRTWCRPTPGGLRYWRNLGAGLLDRPRSLAPFRQACSLGARSRVRGHGWRRPSRPAGAFGRAPCQGSSRRQRTGPGRHVQAVRRARRLRPRGPERAAPRPDR